uniref:Carbonic anhydrase n=1 Tax=Octopus bimaculoides TaxID=37653 RepID=A0A0L8G2A1_OCTBM
MITAAEIKQATDKIKSGKAAGNNNIAFELVNALGSFGVEKLTEIANHVYNSGDVPEEMLESIFITLPKKSGTIDQKALRKIKTIAGLQLEERNYDTLRYADDMALFVNTEEKLQGFINIVTEEKSTGTRMSLDGEWNRDRAAGQFHISEKLDNIGWKDDGMECYMVETDGKKSERKAENEDARLDEEEIERADRERPGTIEAIRTLDYRLDITLDPDENSYNYLTKNIRCLQHGPSVAPAWFQHGPSMAPVWPQHGRRLMTETSPSVWARDYPKAAGQKQSPVNIETGSAKAVKHKYALKADYSPEPNMSCVNNGLTFVATINGDNYTPDEKPMSFENRLTLFIIVSTIFEEIDKPCLYVYHEGFYMYGEECMSCTQVCEWFNRFQDGRKNVDIDERSKRPATSKTEKNIAGVRVAVRGNRRITIRELSEDSRLVMVQFGITEDLVISGGPLDTTSYKLASFHFHWGSNDFQGSEHTINSQAYPAELHLVHWNYNKYATFPDAAAANDGLSVLGVMLKVGEPNAALQQVCDAMKKVTSAGSNFVMTSDFDLPGLVPGDVNKFYTYPGSLTTPPCHESVTWIVCQETIGCSKEQLSILRSLKNNDNNHLVDNFRPVMPLGDRTICCSD